MSASNTLAPELTNPSWVNADPPLRLAEVLLGPAGRGRVVPFGAANERPHTPSVAAESSQVFREDFRGRWKERWMERALTSRRTRYEVVQEEGRPILRATSNKAASLLWSNLGIRTGGKGQISWRWRVQTSISQNQHERAKRGDDYAARLFVVFDSTLFDPRAQAICYVWAAREVVGAVYRSPYAAGVAMIVVESGDQRANQWAAEERDFVADYRTVFGMTPKTVSAVAIMVDTDNTGSSATAWFADIALASSDSFPGRDTVP